MALGVAVLLCLDYADAFEWAPYQKGIPIVLRILWREGLPPDFMLSAQPLALWWASPGDVSLAGALNKAVPWLLPLWDTLTMSIAGTALALLGSFVVGFLAAETTSPHRALYLAARTGLNVARAIPELIMGIVFLVALGPGILAGIFALACHSIGMVGKFFAEAIEHADAAPVEAARASGASELQVLWHGVLPQVLPAFSDVAFYRWEYNFRASTVLGLVGCGGIGLMIQSSLSLMEYRTTVGLLVLVLICVTLVDGVSSVMRKRFQ